MPIKCDTIFFQVPIPPEIPPVVIPQLPPTAVLHFVVVPTDQDPDTLTFTCLWDPPERFD